MHRVSVQKTSTIIIITSLPGLPPAGCPWNWHVVPTVRDWGGPGTGGRPGSPGGTGGPRRQGRWESRLGWLRRVEALRRHRQGGPSLGAHGDPAVQEHQQEWRKAPWPHRQVEPHGVSDGNPVLPGNHSGQTSGFARSALPGHARLRKLWAGPGPGGAGPSRGGPLGIGTSGSVGPMEMGGGVGCVSDLWFPRRLRRWFRKF